MFAGDPEAAARWAHAMIRQHGRSRLEQAAARAIDESSAPQPAHCTDPSCACHVDAIEALGILALAEPGLHAVVTTGERYSACVRVYAPGQNPLGTGWEIRVVGHVTVGTLQSMGPNAGLRLTLERLYAAGVACPLLALRHQWEREHPNGTAADWRRFARPHNTRHNRAVREGREATTLFQE